MARKPVPTAVIDHRWTAQRIRQALTSPAAGWVRVYDAAGRLIAEIDPVTRRRIPVTERSFTHPQGQRRPT